MPIFIGETNSLYGEIRAPPSKAYTHRAFIASFLSKGSNKVIDPLISNDTEATLKAIASLGAIVKKIDDSIEIIGTHKPKVAKHPIDCGESAATLRFLLPVAALADGISSFKLSDSLAKRPHALLLEALRQLNVKSVEKHGLIRVHGGSMKGGRISLLGNISSQFVSGLLFACPKLNEATEIHIIDELESKNYVFMTIDVLKAHGIEVSIDRKLDLIKIPPNQDYSPIDYEIEGDYSSAAFLMVAAAITGSRIRIGNLKKNSLQGDKAIVEILKDTGVKVIHYEDIVEINGGKLSSFSISAKDIPDLVPVCAVLACHASGESTISNIKRLKFKESNRVQALYSELTKMGAKILIDEDKLRIKGPCDMKAAEIYPQNDHRIAMACAIAALRAHGKTKILQHECVNKSYPNFFKDLASIGANVYGL
ncbi:MAG: 3-phosphoshikimate 1-carboxyvinyltransferase [Candidatus Bathyarchaeia archaeon]